jgi:hypothetical protein
VELIAALDTVLDKGSAIYLFRREPNTAAHDLAMALHAECTALWREGGGPQKRMKLLDKAPWQFVSSVVKSIATADELEYVAHLCCKIMQNKGGDTSQMAMNNAFEVLMEVIRLFPRSNFASPHETTREVFIHALQTQFDVLQACMLNVRSLSQSLDLRVIERDDLLQTELWTRLGQLRYLLENTSSDQSEYNLMLEGRQVDFLWEALNGGTECCLRWLRLAADSGGIFEETTQAHLFRKYICKMDPVTIRPHGFNCFQALFADANNATRAWETLGRSGQRSGCKINGPAFVGRRVRVLWRDNEMYNGTICSYCPPTAREPKVQKHTVRWDDTGKEDTHDWTDLHEWHLLEDELSVNILAYEIVNVNQPDALEGLEFMWACLLARDDIVAKKAWEMMLDLYFHMPHAFQQDVLARLADELQKLLRAFYLESSSRVLRVRRYLEATRHWTRETIMKVPNMQKMLLEIIHDSGLHDLQGLVRSLCSVELLCWTQATLQPVCYSASHLQLETVQGEVIQNSDILAGTTYVLRLRLKDEWGCDVDCIPLKQAARQHLTLDGDGPELKILHSNDTSRLLPRRSGKSDECESNEFKAPFYLNSPSGDLLVRFMALESGKLRLTVNVGGVRERAVGKPCCVHVRHRMPSSIRLVCKEEQQLGTLRPEIHHGDNWEVTVEIVDSGGFPVQCKESAVSVDLQQSVQGQTRNGTNRHGHRCASLELSISACSGLEVLPLGKRGAGGVGQDRRRCCRRRWRKGRRPENGGNSGQGGGEDPTLMASRYRISLARPLSPDHFGTFLVQITVRLEDGQDVRLDCIDLGFLALPNRNPEEWSASGVVHYLRSKLLDIAADFLRDEDQNPITGRVLVDNDEVDRTLLLREALEIKKADTESKERIKLISAELTCLIKEANFLKVNYSPSQ